MLANGSWNGNWPKLEDVKNTFPSPLHPSGAYVSSVLSCATRWDDWMITGSFICNLIDCYQISLQKLFLPDFGFIPIPPYPYQKKKIVLDVENLWFLHRLYRLYTLFLSKFYNASLMWRLCKVLRFSFEKTRLLDDNMKLLFEFKLLFLITK